MSFHISHVMYAYVICILIHQVKCLMPNLFSKVKKNMRDQWEARFSAMENAQEKLIKEMNEQLAGLTNLFENMTVHPRSPALLPNQQVPRPFVQKMSHLPRGTDRPNLRQPMPTDPPAFRTASRPTNQPSSSRDKPNGQKIDKNKPQWDPIPVTYTELFPKLVKSGHIEPFQLVPLRPPFPRWYNAHTRCDYHGGNPGHPQKIVLGSDVRSEI